MSHVTSSTDRRGRDDRGQAAVELALVLPLLVMLGLALCQIALIVRDQVLVIHAAREGGRAAAVDPDADAARRAASASSGTLVPEHLDVEVSRRAGPGSRVDVTVRYRSPTDLPLIGPLVGDVALSGSASMRVEV